MLLSSLHCHPECLITVHVFRDTHHTSWHLSLVLVIASEIAWVRSTIAEGNTHSLGRANSNVSSHSTRWLDKIEGENIGNNRENKFVILQLLGQVGEVLNVTEVVGVLYHETAVILCFCPWEIFCLSNMKINSNSVALGLNDINGLREQ